MESCDSFGRRTTLATFIHPPSFNKGSESLTKPIVVSADSVNPSIIIRKRRDTTLLKRKKLYTLIKCLSIQPADLIYDIKYHNLKFGKVFLKNAKQFTNKNPPHIFKLLFKQSLSDKINSIIFTQYRVYKESIKIEQ